MAGLTMFQTPKKYLRKLAFSHTVTKQGRHRDIGNSARQIQSTVGVKEKRLRKKLKRKN
jgi:hypothetical protein